MNSVFRLIANFDFNSAPALLQETNDPGGREEFALRFVDAFAEIDGEGQDVSPTTMAEIEQDSPGDGMESWPPSSPVVLPYESTTMPLMHDNGDSAPSSITGANRIDVIARSAELELQEAGYPTKEIRSQFAPDSMRAGLGADILLLQKLPDSAVRSDNVNSQSNLPIEVLGVPKDQALLLDNRLVASSAENSEPKIVTNDRSAKFLISTPVPINQTASASVSLPVTDVAANVPMATGTAATTPSSLPVFDTLMDDHWIGRLGQEIAKLTGDRSKLSFQLKPQHLGRLHVEIMSDAAGNIVRVDTDNESAKMLILGAQGRLEQDIRLAGSKLLRVDVTEHEHSGLTSGDQDAPARGYESGAKHGEYHWLAEPHAESGRSASGVGDVPASLDGARYA
ncbi:flagellar hook-length control protein FliK [Parasphingorhabdus sp.]|uniref:flagellar hook-length control protein FliK n=1 Tax=Parasphingorhabdus sp. TaxID=2709688 RepID=UPI003BAE68C8